MARTHQAATRTEDEGESAVPNDAESESGPSNAEEVEAGDGSDEGDEASRQLLGESKAAKSLRSPAKSVHFEHTAEESAQILGNVWLDAHKTGRPQASSTRVATGKLKQSALTSSSPKEDITRSPKSMKGPGTSGKPGADLRRSSRPRTDIGTYNDQHNIRVAAGLSEGGQDSHGPVSSPYQGNKVPSAKRKISNKADSSPRAKRPKTRESQSEADNRDSADDPFDTVEPTRAKRGRPPKKPNAETETKSARNKGQPSQGKAQSASTKSAFNEQNKIAPSANNESEIVEPASVSRGRPSKKPNAEIEASPRTRSTLNKGLSRSKEDRNSKVKGIQDNQNEIAPDAESGPQVDSDSAAEVEAIEEDHSLFIPASIDSERLYGQYSILQKLHNTGYKIRSYVRKSLRFDHRLNIKMFLVKDFGVVTTRLRQDYKSLAEANATDENTDISEALRSQIEEMLETMRENLDHLNPDIADLEEEQVEEDDSSDDEEGEGGERIRQKLASQIYAFVFPNLVRILIAAAACHDATARVQGTTDCQLNGPELGELIFIIRRIVGFGEKARKWKTKVESDLKLSKKVHNRIVAPLKQILKAFEKERKKLEKRRQEAAASQIRREQQRRETEECERREQEEDEFEYKLDRLRVLYAARKDAEPSAIRKMSKKLHMPDIRARQQQRYPLDSDANGEEFERVPVFVERPVGSQLPDADAGAMEQDWSDDQMRVLAGTMLEALQTCRGKRMWEKIFMKYCGYKGAFSNLTVAQIMRLASDIQAANLHPLDGLPLEDDWIVNIPDLDLVALL